MSRMALNKFAVLKIILLLFCITTLLSFQVQLPENISDVDLRPYWSSTYLLAHHQDFSDAANLERVERSVAGWKKPYVMYAWFAPTGNVVLLPFTLFSFRRAAYYWLLMNIVVVFVSVLLIWRKTKLPPWIPLAASFGFSAMLLSFIYGQINTMVLLGLTLYLFFFETGRETAAGASLVLTTIKPHLVIFTLPLLLLDLVRKKQWRALVGFSVVLAACAVILFAFYRDWPISFWHLVADGMSTSRQTPTITGLLTFAGDFVWGKWIWVVGLLIAVVLWWHKGRDWNRRSMIDISVMASIIAAPIGWGYDQVMLLFPILTILEWCLNGTLARKNAILCVLVLILIDAASFYERSRSPNEVWFFWIPIVIAGLYGFAWCHRQTNGVEFAPELLTKNVQSTSV